MLRDRNIASRPAVCLRVTHHVDSLFLKERAMKPQSFAALAQRLLGRRRTSPGRAAGRQRRSRSTRPMLVEELENRLVPSAASQVRAALAANNNAFTKMSSPPVA